MKAIIVIYRQGPIDEFYVSLTCIIGYFPFIVSLRFICGNCNLLLQTKVLTYKNNRNYKN